MRVFIAMVVVLFLVSCGGKTTTRGGAKPTHRIISKGFEVVPKEQREERRVALVIGNQNYQFYPVLNNPRKDASDMTAELRRKGFEVIPVFDATQTKMQSAIDKFANILKGGGTGVFYYSGHGGEINGENYLLPIDSKVPSQTNDSRAIFLKKIMAGMKEAKNRFNVVILDACRSRPDGKGSGGGLASPNSASGVFVAYATYPGGISEDGKAGGNGLYTKHLLKELRSNNAVDIKYFFDNVGMAVNAEAQDHQQRPWVSSSMYGRFYFTLPTKVNPNTKKAKIDKLEKLCALNNADSCYELGVQYVSGNTKSIFKTLKFLSKACDLNNSESCSLLGLAYWGGKELPQDYQKAVKLYQKACDLDNVNGCYNLGVGYSTGRGIPKDRPKSLKLFTKACNLNHARACYNLGAIYHNGIIVQKDYQKSFTFYKKSCDLNNKRACQTLGILYIEAEKTPKNFNLGMENFEKACALKDGIGCFMLAVGLERKNKSLAMKYYEKACNYGHKKACQKF